MTIEFHHLNQLILAQVRFNLKQIKDCVLIIPFSATDELGENILLIRENNSWTSDPSLMEKYPLTYQSIIVQIENLIKGTHFLHQFYHQKLLSLNMWALEKRNNN